MARAASGAFYDESALPLGYQHPFAIRSLTGRLSPPHLMYSRFTGFALDRGHEGGRFSGSSC